MLIFIYLHPSRDGYYTKYTIVYICDKYYRGKIQIVSLKVNDPDSHPKVNTDDFKITQKEITYMAEQECQLPTTTQGLLSSVYLTLSEY